jgi:hypothetical protein
MYQAKYADVTRLIELGAEDAAIKRMRDDRWQPTKGYRMAYFHPSNANWSWQIGLYRVDGQLYELLTRFGVVEGGQAIYMDEE